MPTAKEITTSYVARLESDLRTLAECWQEAREYRNWDQIHTDDWDRIITKGDTLAQGILERGE